MFWQNSISPEKKSLGYKERCPEKREAYLQELAEVNAAGKCVVYADESGFRQDGYRRHGYAPRGTTVLGLISSQRRRTTTLLAARFQGSFMETVRLLRGGCKSANFNDWLAEALCPHLTANHVLILDNAMLQKTVGTRSLVERTGAILLFLPPYSPDDNPIEQDFANIKRKREYNPDSTLEDIIQEYAFKNMQRSN